VRVPKFGLELHFFGGQRRSHFVKHGPDIRIQSCDSGRFHLLPGALGGGFGGLFRFPLLPSPFTFLITSSKPEPAVMSLPRGKIAAAVNVRPTLPCYPCRMRVARNNRNSKLPDLIGCIRQRERNNLSQRVQAWPRSPRRMDGVSKPSEYVPSRTSLCSADSCLIIAFLDHLGPNTTANWSGGP